MKKIMTIVVAALAALSLAACTTTEQGAGVGAVAGGLVGATTGTVAGVAIGAGVGAVAGAVIGHVVGQDGYCYYRPDHHHHRRWTARCPGGY